MRRRVNLSIAAAAAFLLWMTIPLIVNAAIRPHAATIQPSLRTVDLHYYPTITTAQAAGLAPNVDQVIDNPTKLAPLTATFRADHPGIKLLTYVNGTYSYTSTHPASWYLRTSSGALIQSKNYGNYLMNPASAGWIGYVEQQCQSAVAQASADGCYLDMLGPEPASATYNTGVAINPATGKPYTESEWLSETLALGQKVGTDTGIRISGNGLGGGASYPQTKSLATLPDGAEAESWMRSAGSSAATYPSLAAWQADLAVPADHAFCVIKVWTSATQQQIDEWRRFSYGTFLLAQTGQSLYEFTPSNKTGWDEAAYTLPGSPLAAMVSHADGLYTRKYTAGLVIVNPTTAPIMWNGSPVPAEDAVIP